MVDNIPNHPVMVVRVIIPDARRRVLILKRRECAYAAGSWCLPGGKVDYGVSVQETIVKELVEETALRCEDARFLFYQDSPPVAEGAMHCINLYFECVVSGVIALNDESSEWAWIGAEDLQHYDIAFGNAEALADYWKA